MKKKLGDCTLNEINRYCVNTRCHKYTLKSRNTGVCELDEILQCRRDQEIER